jgi:hypothetical protein
MVRQYLTVSATSESSVRLFDSVGFVKSDFRDRILDTTLIDVMWLNCYLNKHPELNLKERKRNDTHSLTHRDIHTCTIESLTHICHCHWHPPAYRSWFVHLHDLIPCPRLPTINNYWEVNPLINTWLIRLPVDNRFIDKHPKLINCCWLSITLSIGITNFDLSLLMKINNSNDCFNRFHRFDPD